MGFLLLAAVSFLSGSGCKLFRARALSFSVPQSHVSTRSHPQCRRGRKRVLLTPPQPASPGRRNHLSWAPTPQVRETICRAKKFSPSTGYLEWLLVYALKPGKLQYVQPQEANDTTLGWQVTGRETNLGATDLKRWTCPLGLKVSLMIVSLDRDFERHNFEKEKINTRHQMS